MLRRLAISFLIAASIDFAQQSSTWQGEWGSFQPNSPEGQRMSITSCLGAACQVAIETARPDTGRCGAAGELHIDEGNSAWIALQAPKRECRLELKKESRGKDRVIRVTSQSGNCRDLCTGDCSFTRVFPFHAATPFYGGDIRGCYLQQSKTRMAICADKGLADLEKSWKSLAGTDQKLPNCDNAEDPPACVRAFFVTESQHLLAAQRKWQAELAEPGDAGEGSRKIAAIEGNYRNGKDHLEIHRVGPTSISFAVFIQLANAQPCNAAGNAEYKKNGAFVFRVAQPEAKDCILEIYAADKGVEFQDRNGACRLIFCGERDGLNGVSFPYSERQTSTR